MSVAEKAAHMTEKAKEMLDSDSTGMVVKARSMLGGDAQFFSAAPNFDALRKQLDNESMSQKKEAMKRVLAQICLGQDMSPLFPDVVKNVHAPSIELRKLIYYFIVHYCEDRPNEALLSISAFQHDLIDSSMHVRGLALRTLSSIRISAISPVVLVAIKKASTDLTPLVRKTAVHALVKIHSISGDDSIDGIIDILAVFLGDRAMDVVGSAALAFTQICPTRFDLIHKHFRRICRSLLECDEWGQVAICEMLTRYSRSQFPDPERPRQQRRKVENAKTKKKVDSSSEDEDSSEEDDDDDTLAAQLDLDSDLRLLLQSVKPLLSSTNRAVVLAAVSLYYHLAPRSDLDLCAKPLVRILNMAPSGHFLALRTIYNLVMIRPKPFMNYIKDFFLHGTDTAHSRQLKLRVIAKLVTKENHHVVLNEFRSYLRSYDPVKVVDTVKGLGMISFQLPDAAATILKLVTPLLNSSHQEVVTESVVVLRQLVVQSSDKLQIFKIVQKLSHKVVKGDIKASQAKATIVWLVGENIRTHPSIAKLAPDFFRVFVKDFVKEDPAVKNHVLNLGSKIWFNLEGEGELANRFKQMFFYLLELVRYDPNFDIRDQGRIIEAALERSSTTFQHLKQAILGAKPLPQHHDRLADRAGFTVGSMSHALGLHVSGHKELQVWPEVPPDSTVRDPPDDRATTSSDSDRDSDLSTTSDDENVKPGKGSDSFTSDSDPVTDETDDSSDDDGPKRPTAAIAKAPPAKIVVVKRTVTAPKPAAKDRVIEELFTAKSKPAEKHTDPSQNSRSISPEQQ